MTRSMRPRLIPKRRRRAAGGADDERQGEGLGLSGTESCAARAIFAFEIRSRTKTVRESVERSIITIGAKLEPAPLLLHEA